MRMSRIAAGILAGALLWACVVCARWGLADLAISDVMALEAQVVDRLARTGVGATPQEAEALFGTLKFAQQLEPANPAVAEHFGQLHFLGLVSAAPNDSGHTSTLTPYLRAVRLRPTSGYAWANFAWAKYHLGQVDQKFYRALEAAMRMGPWEHTGMSIAAVTRQE